MEAFKAGVFWIGLGMATVLPPILSLSGKDSAAVFCVVSGLIAMLGTRFGDIVVLAFGPLRAELAAKIDEADKTMGRVKELAATTAKTALDLIQSTGRWDGLTDEHRDELYLSYKNLLDELKIDRQPIEAFWHEVIEFDYGHMVLGGSTIPTGATDEERTRWDGLQSGIQNRPTAEELRSFLNDTGYMTDEREELIVDLEYYQEHLEHRRPEVWANRKKYFVNNPLKRPD